MVTYLREKLRLMPLSVGLQNDCHDRTDLDADHNALPHTLVESDAHEDPYPRLTAGNGLSLPNGRMSDKARFIMLASLEDRHRCTGTHAKVAREHGEAGHLHLRGRRAS